MKREVVLDTETTGLDPNSGHRVVEIGCVELIGGIRSGKHFHCYLNPERDMPAEAQAVHGLSAEFLSDKPLFAAVVEDFLAFIADSPLVIHNAGFDMKFLNAELTRAGKEALPFERAVDTVIIARKKFPGAPASLDALCKRFEIDLSSRTKHGALLDSELLADVYLELCGGRQTAMLLGAQTQEEVAVEVAKAVPVDIEHRHFPASAEELKAHENMLASMKEPLWKKEESAA